MIHRDRHSQSRPSTSSVELGKRRLISGKDAFIHMGALDLLVISRVLALIDAKESDVAFHTYRRARSSRCNQIGSPY
jgi:hypothetical protein